MQIVDNAIILILIVLAFVAGKRTADSYHKIVIKELRWQLRLNAAKEGVGYVAPPVDEQPKKRVPIGQLFMDKMRENGRAVQQIHNS